MRSRPFAPAPPSLAAVVALAAMALTAWAVADAAAAPQMGVGPAECVQAAAPAQCEPAEEQGRGQPAAGGSPSGAKPAGGVQPGKAAPGPGTEDAGAPFRFFAPGSVWNTPVDGAELDPSSAKLTAALADEVEDEVRERRGPAINTTAYSVPVYTVPESQPTVQVELRGNSPAAALRAAWSAVPLPPNARPAAGTDGHLVVWQPSSDQLWEFWRLRHREDGWHADWGGAIRDASSGSGVYDASAWPGATPWWGASASSLSIAGGLITLEDLERGRINHALAIALPQVRAGVYALPAQRTDGKSGSSLALPEGAHLRLDPSLDVGSLGLPRLTRMIAEAAQRYGLIVRDGASSVALYAQDPTPTGENPFPGPSGYFEGPRAPLGSFPWERLQLLGMELVDPA